MPTSQAAQRKERRRKIKLRRPGVAVRVAAPRVAPARRVAVGRTELKPLPQYFFKRAPPLPPPATKLLTTGHKQIKDGRIQRRVLPRDSRAVGIPMQTGPSYF